MPPACAGFLHAFAGILYAGCIPVPIYPPARLSQLDDHLRRQAAILANAEAELLVTVREGRTLAHFLRSTVQSMRSTGKRGPFRASASLATRDAPIAGPIRPCRIGPLVLSIGPSALRVS